MSAREVIWVIKNIFCTVLLCILATSSSSPLNDSWAHLFSPISSVGDSKNTAIIIIGSSKFGEGNGTLLQYSCLENPMDGGAWKAAVHGVATNWTRLSDFTFTFHFHALEMEMATHSSVLAWRIPGTGEPGGLPSMGSHRVRHA